MAFFLVRFIEIQIKFRKKRLQKFRFNIFVIVQIRLLSTYYYKKLYDNIIFQNEEVLGLMEILFIDLSNDTRYTLH